MKAQISFQKSFFFFRFFIINIEYYVSAVNYYSLQQSIVTTVMKSYNPLISNQLKKRSAFLNKNEMKKSQPFFEIFNR